MSLRRTIVPLVASIFSRAERVSGNNPAVESPCVDSRHLETKSENMAVEEQDEYSLANSVFHNRYRMDLFSICGESRSAASHGPLRIEG
jgi:hypothetical protein